MIILHIKVHNLLKLLSLLKLGKESLNKEIFLQLAIRKIHFN